MGWGSSEEGQTQVNLPLHRSDRTTALDNPDQYNNDGQDQQNMDEPAQRV